MILEKIEELTKEQGISITSLEKKLSFGNGTCLLYTSRGNRGSDYSEQTRFEATNRDVYKRQEWWHTVPEARLACL